MNNIFKFDELTWPEVKALPPDIPLVLPLGAGYDLNSAAAWLIPPASDGTPPALSFWLAW